MIGTFASVTKEVTPESTLAIKTYSKQHGKLVLEHYQREVKTLKRLDLKDANSAKEHHIVYLSSIHETPSSYQLFLTWYDYNLRLYLEQPQTTTRHALAHSFLQQISQGLLFIHSHGIIHCDISPDNILIDTNGNMCIGDFGCSRMINEEDQPIQNEVIGTRWYKAPEYLFGYKMYAPSTDIWSLGATFTELLIGKPLFQGNSDLEQIGLYVKTLGVPSKQAQKEMSIYPDANKLNFFDMDDPDSDMDDEEYEESPVKPLEEVLEHANVDMNDRILIRNMLTWSIKDRFTIEKAS
ncbi:Cyclin-dependent kinase 20 [Rhizopus azygosporus]|uniref:Cyclin-dependent kinase 20 n=1 Tax=Rhizopus azygosporus TaxID=86630 RepID=A0A367K9T0_RHIAZ|nr:Cyclin-dependent kinase 20 [Rhizopus azygosporus]